jgi:sigma-E factor negative regulatory protein RseB
MSITHSCRALIVALACQAPAVVMADNAHDWLRRIGAAANNLTYEGVFVYRHGEQLQSMRIAHKVQGGTVRERLVALNGPGREVIRTGEEVRCYLPDENAVLVEHRKANDKGFPNLLPPSLTELERNYTIELGRSGRQANRPARLIVIRPNDGYRYGYHIWADEATGLPLMASLVNDKGAVIEQFMFTQVNIGVPLSDAEFEPRTPGKDLVVHRNPFPAPAAAAGPPGPVPGRLPVGFMLSTRTRHTVLPLKTPVEHLVYSDGLAVVSVFVQRLGSDGAAPTVEGLVNKGAVHALGRVVDGHRVTVIGEVPATTVHLIGQSLAPAR